MPDSRPPVLRATGVGVVYPNGHRALYPTDLDVREGEFVVLLGPSGAGKSTLLRTLNALVPASEGQVELKGAGVVRSRADVRLLRRRAAMVFQQHQLIGRLSALSNVLTGRLGAHGALRTLLPWSRPDRLVALEALDRVGLLECALRRCDQLSGGQQQRVGIARALAQQPAVILADEPVASLDPATAERVLLLFHGICRSTGIAAVVSLHQVELARRFADRIVGIAGGRVAFDAPVRAVDDAALSAVYGAASAKVSVLPLAEAA